MSTNTDTDVPPWATGDTDSAPGEGADAAELAAATELPTMTPAFKNFIDWLTEKADGDDSDTNAALVDLIEEMAHADDPAAVLAGGYPLHAEEVLGRPMGCYGLKIREGEHEENENLGFYAVLDVEFLDDHSRRTVTMGGHKVLAKLYGLDVRNAWPYAFVIRAHETKSGRRRYDLHPVE